MKNAFLGGELKCRIQDMLSMIGFFCFVSKVYSNSNVFVLVNKFELNLHLKLCFVGLGSCVVVWMVIECVFGG